MTSLVCKDYGLDPDLAAIIARRNSAQLITNISESKRVVVQRVVARAIREGWTNDELQARLQDVVGLDVRGLNAVETFRQSKAMQALPAGVRRIRVREYANRLKNHRAGLIARNELKMAQNGAQRVLWANQQDSGQLSPNHVKKSVAKEGCCAKCAELDGAMTALTEIEVGPPWHVNCLPGSVLVSADAGYSAMQRWYSGDMIEIRTQSGYVLTGTPNHPVLTENGWVGLGKINRGVKVVVQVSCEGLVGVDPEDDQQMVRIEDRFHSLRVDQTMTTVSMEVSPEDFHGDGVGGEVSVVLAESLLRDEAAFIEVGPDDGFVTRGRDTTFNGKRSTTGLVDPDLLASPCCVRCGDPFLPQLGGDGLVVDPSLFSNGPDGDSIGHQSLSDHSSTYSVPTSDELDAVAGKVALDDVVEIRRYPFSGHVYNLTTNCGWYVANGVVTHNCRCDEILDVVPYVLKAAPRDGDGDGKVNDGLPTERLAVKNIAPLSRQIKVPVNIKGPDQTNQDAWELILTDEARELDGLKEELHPDRYAPNKAWGYHLKTGATDLKMVPPSKADGRVLLNVRQAITWQELQDLPAGQGALGEGDGVPRKIIETRPPKHLFRVMSIGEFNQALDRGYFQSDERMNLASGEGTVASVRSTGSFYVPTDGSPYRIVRFTFDNADGWRLDDDSYIKTDQQIPFSRVSAYTTALQNPRVTKAEPRDGDGDGFVDDGKPTQHRVIHRPDPNMFNRMDYTLQLVQMDPKDLPDTVYHVTTALSAIQASGYLRAGLGENGLGGAQTHAVSFTVDKDIAEGLVRDMRLMVEAAQFWKANPDSTSFSHWLEKVSGREGWSLEGQFGPRQLETMRDSYEFRDWMNTYLSYRASATGMKNPLFFGVKVDQWAAINYDDIGIVEMPKKTILASGAAVGDFDTKKDYGLKEVRVFADLPIKRSFANQAAVDTIALMREIHPFPEKLPRFMELPEDDPNEGFYDPNNVAVHISPRSKHPMMAIAHEMMHHFDFEVVGGRKAEDDSKNALRLWIGAMIRTRTYKAIWTEATTDGRMTDWAKYASSPHECLARVYAQYVATRSGDPRMLAELRSLREKDPLNCWTDDELEAMVPALEHLMKIWLKEG